jgi:hypothetical protein
MQGRRNQKAASLGARNPLARSNDLVVEELDGELLIYDRTNKRAHCLGPLAAQVFQKCDGNTNIEAIAIALDVSEVDVARAIEELEGTELLDSPQLEIVNGNGRSGGITRRELTKRSAQVGGAVVAAPLILSIAAPTAMAAISPPPFVCELYTTQDCGTGSGCAAIKGCCCCCQGEGSCKVCSSVNFCNSGQQQCIAGTAATSKCSSVGTSAASVTGCCGVPNAKQCGCAWGAGGGCCNQHTGAPCSPPPQGGTADPNCVPCCNGQILVTGSAIGCCATNSCVTVAPS